MIMIDIVMFYSTLIKFEINILKRKIFDDVVHLS
jgi:hypothetical protein